MSQHLISVIVPVYNAEKYLYKCVDSIINQDYKNLEIILINDGSIDNSSMICDEFSKKDARVKVIHKKNEGVSIARNYGLNLCSGEYVYFVDSDDYIELNLFSKMYKYIEKDYDIIKFQSIKETKKYRKASTNSKTGNIDCTNKEEILDLFINKHEFGPVWNSIFKKNTIAKIRFNENYKYGEDYLFYLEVILNSSKIYITNEVFYHYVVLENSATHKINTDGFLEQIKNHYDVDYIVYKKVMDLGFIQYKTGLLECTYNMIINLLKQLATETNYKNYNNILNKLLDSDFYKRYDDLNDCFKIEELNSILKNNRGYYFIKYKIIGKIKKFLKIILR